MKKSMSSLVIAAIAIAAIMSVFGTAEAQTYTPTDPVLRGSSFEPAVATANSGFLGFESINPVAGDGAAAGDVGGTGGGLAITGAETDIPLAVGIGLLAIGGTAVVASRKRDE